MTVPNLSTPNLIEKNIHIVGVSGAEGASILLFLWAKGCKHLTAHDFVSSEEFDKSFRVFHLALGTKERFKKLQELKSLPIQIHYRDTYLEGIDRADIIFASQGWIKHQANYPKLKNAVDRGIPLATLTQLYFQYSKAPIIAVTGSNGKSTTAAMIHHILSTAGRSSYLAGNARESGQVLEYLDSLTSEDYLVLEVSDRQLLADIPKGPHIAVLTNLTPNHLDDHGSFENYRKTKQRLFEKQTEHDSAILNSTLPDSQYFVDCTEANTLYFTNNQCKQDGLYLDEQLLIKNEDILVLGHHNKLNILAAATACKALSLSLHEISCGIKTFKGLPHRTSLVSKKGGVSVYDDIQSTTPESTIAAMHAFEHKLILVAGGDDKGMTYEELAETIVKKVKKLILLPGTGTRKIKAQLQSVVCSYSEVESFLAALEEAFRDSAEGDILLISPGCAHFQSNYLKGKSVKTWVDELKFLPT